MSTDGTTNPPIDDDARESGTDAAAGAPAAEPVIQSSPPAKPKPRRRWASWLLLAIVAVAVYVFVGFYTIPPIGALPQGATVLIWKGFDRPFFDSPDRLCLDRSGGVSLLCRGLAIGALKPSQIILRLPYQDWAYLVSTQGEDYSH